MRNRRLNAVPVNISAATVTDWAEGTLFEWLPGWIWDDKSEQEYRVTVLRNNVIRVEPRYGNQTDRVFYVSVVVREIP